MYIYTLANWYVHLVDLFAICMAKYLLVGTPCQLHIQISSARMEIRQLDSLHPLGDLIVWERGT